MQKVMLFIDFENFNIAVKTLYKNETLPKLDYNLFPKKIVERLSGDDNRLVKTFLFAPKPDDFLLKDEKRKRTYEWVRGLNNQRYFTVIEGQHVARPVAGFTFHTMDINNPASYFVVEKGTDVNMATHLVTKGFLHAYDTAIVVSGDTDYIPTLDVLNIIGKTTVCTGVKGQNLLKLKKHSDDILVLDKDFFDDCCRS